MKRIIVFILIIALVGGAVYYFFFKDKSAPAETPQPTATPVPFATLSPQTGTGEYVSPGKLIINEVCASNNYCLSAPDGTSPDWIELYNGTNENINLSGYGITDDTSDRYKFQFPNVFLGAGEYIVVFATSDKDDNPSDGYYRLGFKLASAGEELILSAPADVTVDTLKFENMVTDITYGRADDGSYVYFGLPTPGERNAGPVNKEPVFEGGVVASDIEISEFMSDNEYSIVDEDGDRSDWVELYNRGSQAVSLAGYGLSDDRSDAKKWIFPEVEIQPGEYKIVFLSGKDKSDPAGKLHASFSLGSTDDILLLCESHGKTIDSVTVEPKMGANISKGRSPDDASAWVYFPTPTPGKANNTKYFDTIDKATEKYLPDLRISEVKTVGEARTKEADWIELVNKGGQAIDLKGYGLSDDIDSPFLYTFGETSIAAGQYLVVEVGSKASADAGKKLSLSFAGEKLYLSEPDGTVVDVLRTGIQREAISSGRAEDGSTSERVFFTTPTKGAANDGTYYTAYAAAPVFSKAGGYVEAGATVELSAEEGATIYYTTNGSPPTTGSTAYSGPITISKSTPVRAIAVVSGKLNSDVATENYLVTEKHDIPVVCIATDHDGFFGETNGIHSKGPGYVDDSDGDGVSDTVHQGANYWKDVERAISFEFFEADGTKGVEFPAGIRIFGQYSREEDQKSFSIYLRGAYGLSEVTYPFFRDYDVTTFSSLILRISGQDWTNTKIRDAFFAQAVKGEMDIDYMEYRPVAVYINGEYWGLYNLREKQTADYVYNHTGTAQDNVDILKGDNTVQAGSKDQWLDLREWLGNHNSDLSDDANYQYVANLVDVDEFINYIIVETYFNNTDTGNIRCWKPRDGGKWRWMLFDLDWGMSDAYVGGVQTYTWNMIEEFFNPAGHGVGHAFQTRLQCSLKTNYTWRKKFIETYAYHINNTFQSERLNKLIDAMTGEIKTEMARQIERWKKPASMEKWESNVQFLKDALAKKIEITIEDIQQYFGLSAERMHELFPKYK